MHFIIFIFVISFSHAQSFKGGFKINPELGLKTVESRSGVWRGEGQGIEISVKVTTLTSEAEAKELAKVEYQNVMHLYDERGNPYQGQISQLVVCDPKFKPREGKVQVAGQPWPVIFAGANGRKAFGACNPDQVTNWAAYTNFVELKEKVVIAARLFTPVNAKDVKEIEAARARLQAMVGRLFMREKP